MGLFITFEGIEGCGKTTQLQMAGDYLATRSIPFISTAEPGGTPLGGKIREILLNRGPYALCAEAELLLFCAARSQHVQDVIQPALTERKVVLCDRFADATIVYQGYGRGLDIDFIRTLTNFSARDLQPDLTLLLDLPVQDGLARAFDRISRNQDRPSEDRFEREALTFHHKIREGYRTLANREPERFRIIDATQTISRIHQEICRILEGVLEEQRNVL